MPVPHPTIYPTVGKSVIIEVDIERVRGVLSCARVILHSLRVVSELGSRVGAAIDTGRIVVNRRGHIGLEPVRQSIAVRVWVVGISLFCINLAVLVEVLLAIGESVVVCVSVQRVGLVVRVLVIAGNSPLNAVADSIPVRVTVTRVGLGVELAAVDIYDPVTINILSDLTSVVTVEQSVVVRVGIGRVRCVRLVLVLSVVPGGGVSGVDIVPENAVHLTVGEDFAVHEPYLESIEQHVVVRILVACPCPV